jgi:hypothetical protein
MAPAGVGVAKAPFAAGDQITPSRLLVRFVSRSYWDAGKVRRFPQKHPELELLWPERGVRR